MDFGHRMLGRRIVVTLVHESTNGKPTLSTRFRNRSPEVTLDLKGLPTESWLVAGSGTVHSRGPRGGIYRAQFCAWMANPKERVPQLLSGC